jgi:ubiquinone biosynthesis protein UbiJ
MVLDLPGVVLRPFESLLNHGLARSATATAIATRLEGRSLAIEATGLPRAFRLAITGGRATLTASDAPADVTIAGTPLSLLRLLATDPQALFRDGELALTGSPDLAAEFRELLQFAAPDLEDLLARVVGDPLAHQAGVAAAGVRATAGRATESLARSLGEYLTEERRSLPSRFEADEFAAAVDELVAAVDRAEARLAQLAAGRRGGGDAGPA